MTDAHLVRAPREPRRGAGIKPGVSTPGRRYPTRSRALKGRRQGPGARAPRRAVGFRAGARADACVPSGLGVFGVASLGLKPQALCLRPCGAFRFGGNGLSKETEE